jgi:guanylate kinase
VRAKCPDAVSVFLHASSWQECERRLRLRRQDDEAAILRRLATAREELARAGEYQFEVINDDLDTAVEQLRAIISRQFERSGHAG